MSITAAKTVAVAATATAEALGSAEAAKRFMAELKGARHVKEIMSAAQQRRFARLHGFEPIFDQSKSVTHDHVEMAASRSLKVAELEARLAEVEGEILLVGCGSMEIHRYAADPRYVLHFHASESKDTSRSLQVLAGEARRRWRDGLSARERFSLRNLSTVHQARLLALDAVAKLANTLGESGEGEAGEMDWRRRKAARIVVSRSYPVTGASVAACFDSVYSMGEKGLNALLRTGIQEVYGTMFAPYELLWRNVVTHPWYVYREHKDCYGRTVSQVAFSSEFGGYSGGYTHLKEDWAWLLNNQAWTSVASDCKEFKFNQPMSVVSEIISWDGPMLAFKVVKTAVVDNPVRAITLPKWARHVRVLDLFKSFDAQGKPKKKQYFSVSEAGVESLMTYLFGVKPTDVHALVAVGYIRRHMHGMEMAGNVHEESWGLDEENVYGLAVVASALAWGISSQVKVVLSETDNLTVQDSNWRKFLGFLKTSAAVIASIGLIIPAKMLWDWLVADSLIPDLMIKPGHVIWQQRMGGVVAMEDAIFSMDPPTARFTPDDIVGGTDEELAEEAKEMKLAEASGMTVEQARRAKVSKVRKTMADGGYVPLEDAGELLGGQTGCYLCDRWRGKMGAQVTRCSHVEDNTAGFDWSLEEAEVLAWKNELIEAAKEAPTNLAKVIKQAYEGLPGGEWRLGEVETYLVESGPGTGKSFGARLLYDETTLFYAPFGKLRVDYMQKEHNGVKVDMAFKTTHQGMYYSGTVETLVVDEFTAMDRRAVCTMLRKTGAKRVLLFGDRRQTGLMASEGAPILAYNDLSKVSKHEFLVNFRNEAWYVALLNLYYGYEMRAFKGGFVGPEIAGLEDFAKEATERVSINFSHATAADTYSAEGHTNSVRANQGSTHPSVGLVIGDTDTAHLQNPQLLRVAFSRQQESLKVYGDAKSPAMALVKQALHMEDEMLWAAEEAVRREYVAKNVGRQLVVVALEAAEEKEKEAELDVVAESVVIAEEAKAAVLESVAARTYTSFFGVVGERVDDAEEASTCLEGQRQREAAAKAAAEAAAATVEKKLHEAYLEAVERSAEADKEFCEKDAPLSKVMSVVFPFLGKLKDITPATLDAAVDFVKFIKSISWCSLVAVCRVLGFTTRTVTRFLVFVYEKFMAGADVAADGVSDFVLQQFFLDRGIAAWVVEKATAAFPGEKGQVVKVLRPVDVEMSPMTILHGTPGHIDFFAPLEEEVLAERKMVLKHGGGIFGAKTVEVFGTVASVVKKYNLFGKHISLRSAAVTGGGFELRVMESVELRGMLYQASGMRSSEMVNLSVEEAAVLEHMELGPMPSEVKVEAIVPVMLLPEFETPELVSTMEEKPSYDAFRHLVEFDSLPGLGDTWRCANEEAAVAGQLGQVRGGKLDANVRDPINKRFRPVETVKAAEAISIGDGNHFFAGDRAQAVQSAAHRYMKKGRGGQQVLTDEGKRLAWKMADEFKSECMRDELHIDEDAEAEAWQDWIKASRRKSYVKRAMAEPEEYKTTINYFCKNQYKPAKNGKCDHMKVGQGISAWSARAVGECGGHIRLANLRFLLNLKENVVYDNKITEEALARQVNMMVDRLPTGVKSATTDVVEMDSIQDIFTQEIERRLLWWLGFGAQFVDYYYSFRSQYPLLCRGVFTATGGSEKTSGEPGTLLFNSILSAVFANFLMRGVGEFVMVIKGDDNNKWQQGLALDEVRYSAVKAQSHYRMVITFGQAEFCGKIITEGAMLPSVNRTVAKLVAQRFRNMAHFHEYQKAVRDKVKMMKRIGTEKVLMATAQVHGMNLPAVRANWDALESFSYLSYKQFSDVKMTVYTSSGIIGMFD